MFFSKYIYVIVIIVIIALLLFLYYMYTEMTNIKKTQNTIQSKTLELESDVSKVNSTITKINNSKVKSNRIDSPIMSISYNSDLVRQNESLRYTDISDNVAKNIKETIKNNQSEKSNDNLSSIKTSVLISDTPLKKNSIQIFCSPGTPQNKSDTIFDIGSEKSEKKIEKKSDAKSDIIEFNLDKILKKDKVDSPSNNKFQQLLDGLTNVIKNEKSESYGEIELNHDIIKNISDTLKMTDNSDEKSSSINK